MRRFDALYDTLYKSEIQVIEIEMEIRFYNKNNIVCVLVQYPDEKSNTLFLVNLDNRELDVCPLDSAFVTGLANELKEAVPLTVISEEGSNEKWILVKSSSQHPHGKVRECIEILNFYSDAISGALST